MKPLIELDNAVVFHGSNLDVLPFLADNSVDSIVTDPPYELGFMGKSWDSSGIAYNVELWRECLRVLKPGGHLLSFGGTRTWHRIACAIEDAGFEVRDSIAWLYGSGFPKSHNISKAIDKEAGAEREVVGEHLNAASSLGNGVNMSGGLAQQQVLLTAPATDDAKKWDGWGTALKPAFEPVVVARKPLIGTVAQNVLEWGTGGLNIDASRIGTETVTINTFDNGAKPFGGAVGEPYTAKTVSGRWPANILLDEYTAELLDEQAPSTGAFAKVKAGHSGESRGIYGDYAQRGDDGATFYGDGLGGASRFFYVAKANKRDRNEGLEHLEDGRVPYESHRANFENTKGVETPFAGAGRSGNNLKNFHPTVKPTDLMRYLIKLVTPPNGTVLDPFTGSGSTGKAALLDGYKFVGIELTEEYLPIIQGRLEFAQNLVENNKQNEEVANAETLF